MATAARPALGSIRRGGLEGGSCREVAEQADDHREPFADPWTAPLAPFGIDPRQEADTLTAYLQAKQLHPSSQRLVELMEEAKSLHIKKSADYGAVGDPFRNLRSAEDFGVTPWVGAAIRANDKMRRIMSFATKGELQNESVLDAFTDLAVYALICRVLYEEESGRVGRAQP